MENFTVEPLPTGRQALKLESRLRLPQFTPTLKLILIGIGLVLVVGVTFLVYGHTSFAERSVQISIDGPRESASGDHVTYTVRYANGNRAALDQVHLAFSYPSDAVVLKDDSVSQMHNESIDLGTLKGKSSGERSFDALLIGSQGEIKTAKAILTYTPADIASQLQKTAETSATITALPVPLDVVAPPTVINGQTLTYLIDYRNQSGGDLSNLRVKVTYPDGFTPVQKKDTWDIQVLKEGEGGRISIQGTLAGREREAKVLSVALQKQIPTSLGLVYVDFEKGRGSSVIATPLLSATLTLQDARDYTAHVGDRLKYAIRVTNNTNFDISSLTLTAKLSGAMYDGSSEQSGGAFDSRTNTITWNSAVVPELGNLGANQSVVIPFEINVKSTFPAGNLGTKDSLIKASVHAETLNVPEGIALDRLSADDDLTTRISTSPTFAQRLTVNDPQWGTQGPYPPNVDQTTVYTVHWSLINPSNDVGSAKITAVLLPGVTWKNQVRSEGLPAGQAGSQAQPTYSSKTSTLTWDIGTLPSGVGITFPSYELYFQIAATPSVNQIGQSIPLLKTISFQGTDVLTKEQIVRTVSDLNSQPVQQ